jgi:RNA polymerase sigma-70 factor (ECF subfamily)
MNESDIEQCICRVQTGHIEDYRPVVGAYHARLRRWLSAFCPPALDPDEVAHLAFIEAYHRIEKYQPGTDFFAWLCAFARNLFLAECEKIQRRARNQQNYLELYLLEEQSKELAASDADPDLRSRPLLECLKLLKSHAREVISLRYTEGLRVTVISQRLGRSPSALRVQLFGLRKILRDCVAQKMAAPLQATYGPV